MNAGFLYDLYMGGGELNGEELHLLIEWLKEQIDNAKRTAQVGRERWFGDVLAIAESDYEAATMMA